MGDKRDGAEKFGTLYDVIGVDAENIGLFAKTARVLGVIIIVGFILWGLFYGWSSSRGPFEQLVREIGIRSQFRFTLALFLSAIFFIIGIRYRFQVSIRFCMILFRTFDFIASVFRKT